MVRNRFSVRTSVVGGVSLFILTGLAMAQEKRYEGEIVAVDVKEHTFTVKGTATGEPAEMKFHVGKDSEVVVEGERKLFAELERGDRVAVTYGTADGLHTVKRAERHHTAVAEMSFTGQVTEVDAKSQTFTVKRIAGGQSAEMKFHVSPTTRLYVGAEQLAVLQQLKTGDEVTVSYETAGEQHHVKHVGRARPKTT